MTEYSHVTDTGLKIGGAVFNPSTVKLYVDTAADNWSSADLSARVFLREAIPGRHYKTKSKSVLFENYFRSGAGTNSLDFWENLLGDMSDTDQLDMRDEVKDYIRKALLDVIGIYINHDCVLLPTSLPGDPERPKWHARGKPSILGHPYDELFAAYKKSCEGNDYRERRVKGNFANLCASLRLSDFDAYTEEVDVAIAEIVAKRVTGRKPRAEYSKIMQVIADTCSAKVGGNAFTTALIRYGHVRGQNSSPVVATVDSNSTPVRAVDPHGDMRHYIREQIKEYGIAKGDSWMSEISDWIFTVKNHKIYEHYADICLMFAWMAENDMSNKGPHQLYRKHFVRTHDSADVETTYFDYLKSLNLSPHRSSRVVRHSVGFFAHFSDRNLDENGNPVPAPINESDKKRFADTDAKLRGKSNKPVLPRRIMEMAKDILLEDNYAFAKQFDDQYVIYNDGGAQKLFVPTISHILFLILTLPIRTAQAMMLDSGEADEFKVDLHGNVEKNTHPLVTRGRRLGYARRYTNQDGTGQFCGIFVNTNKENALRQKGYEIPFHDPRLMEVLAFQREFQETFNPTEVMVNRSQVAIKDLRYAGNNIEQLENYTFLFRDIRRGGRRWDVLSRSAINKLWLRLLQEVQNRLAALENPVALVWEDDKGELKTSFTLHSLRVSNITHFIEAGVPLHVLAEFLSGHQTLIMTLYYTKLGPQKINEVIAEAAKNLVESDEDEFFDRLTEMSEELLGQHVIGKNDGLARLPSGDPGLWHIDVDGICTAGKQGCHEGLERRDLETDQVSYESIQPDGFNCALCRFYVTGPAFLAGQVTVVNTLLFAIQQRSEQENELFEKLTAARQTSNNRAARRAQDNYDKVRLELEHRIASLGARIGNIYACLDLLRAQEEGRSQRNALITKMDKHELEAQLEKASNFQSVEWVAQAVEFFPQLPENGARFRKGILLEKMAQENGIRSLLLQLSNDEMLRVANRLTALMADFYGQAETNDLLSGKLKLAEVGGLDKFQALVGKAFTMSEVDAPAEIGQANLIEVDDDR